MRKTSVNACAPSSIIAGSFYRLYRLHNKPPPTTPERNDRRYKIGQQLRGAIAERLHDLWTQEGGQGADTSPSLWARLQKPTVPTTRVPGKNALGTPDTIVPRCAVPKDDIIIMDSSKSSSESESDDDDDDDDDDDNLGCNGGNNNSLGQTSHLIRIGM
jgi:hypothetical protein